MPGRFLSTLSRGKLTRGRRTIPGSAEIVISFFKHDTFRIGSVAIATLSNLSGMRDVEVWASSTSAAEGFTKLAQTTIPREPNSFQQPSTTLTFPPVDARFVKVCLTTHHPSGRSLRTVQIKVMEASGTGYVPMVQ
jgi:hypothetical protein